MVERGVCPPVTNGLTRSMELKQRQRRMRKNKMINNNVEEDKAESFTFSELSG